VGRRISLLATTIKKGPRRQNKKEEQRREDKKSPQKRDKKTIRNRGYQKEFHMGKDKDQRN
jgi:hypothetical protein